MHDVCESRIGHLNPSHFAQDGRIPARTHSQAEHSKTQHGFSIGHAAQVTNSTKMMTITMMIMMIQCGRRKDPGLGFREKDPGFKFLQICGKAYL